MGTRQPVEGWANLCLEGVHASPIYHERVVRDAADDVPEHLIAAHPAFWLDSQMGASIEPDVMADYIRCFSDPGTIAGWCADHGVGHPPEHQGTCPPACPREP
jgi:hypothetical protein